MKRETIKENDLFSKDMQDRYLTQKEASDEFNIPQEIIEKASTSGELDFEIRKGETVYHWQDLIEFADEYMKELLEIGERPIDILPIEVDPEILKNFD